MDAEKEAAKKMGLYRQMAEQDKSIDATALMLSALEQAQRSEVDARKKRWAYLVSVGLPPVGLFYAFRYYFSDKDDGKKVALYCVILTAVSLLAAWAIGKAFLSNAGPQLQQIQTIDPAELRELLQ